MHKKYLGDSVYAEMDDAIPEAIWLTTENGYEASNKVFLEPEVQLALHRYIAHANVIARDLREADQSPSAESSPAGEDNNTGASKVEQ
jgi:hypothetical protein